MPIIQTTINDLRNASLSTFDEYYVTDVGKEGYWTFENQPGYPWMDNLGTILYNSNSGGLVRRVFNGNINVKWFGAIGDGIVDDTANIQAAINACQIYGLDANGNPNGVGYGSLYIPTGIYSVNELNIQESNQSGYIFGKINIVGDGIWYSIFMFRSDYKPVTGHEPTMFIPTVSNIFSVKSPFVTFEKIGIEGFVLEKNVVYQSGEEGNLTYWGVYINSYLCNGINLDGNASNSSTNNIIIQQVGIRTCEIGINVNGGGSYKNYKLLDRWYWW